MRTRNWLTVPSHHLQNSDCVKCRRAGPNDGPDLSYATLRALRSDAATGVAELPQASRGVSTRHAESVRHDGTRCRHEWRRGTLRACATKANGPGYGGRRTDSAKGKSEPARRDPTLRFLLAHFTSPRGTKSELEINRNQSRARYFRIYGEPMRRCQSPFSRLTVATLRLASCGSRQWDKHSCLSSALSRLRLPGA